MATKELLKSPISPNAGPTVERRLLHERFRDRLCVNPRLTRKLVSYQGNKNSPGLRWMKYKEGFYGALVGEFLDDFKPRSILDPFAGIGTAPLVAAGRGLQATGIEIMPFGVLTGQVIAYAANGLRKEVFGDAAASLIEEVQSGNGVQESFRFPHVRITEAAFPLETEEGLARARSFIDEVKDADVRAMLDFLCMSVLESVSYTRKDGQYLRWDYRSGRRLRSRVNKGQILPLAEAIRTRASEILEDMESLKDSYGGGSVKLITGSSLERLRRLPSASYDMVITSPPYANRYDYTRTYALELAWLGYGQDAFVVMRQSMLSATVENRSKRDWLQEAYGDSELVRTAFETYKSQGAIHEILSILRQRSKELGNPHVIRLLEGYFLEMAVVIAELGRIVKPGGSVIMINDNVQYHGEEVSVDLILSDYAERSGFACKQIWALPKGKGIRKPADGPVWEKGTEEVRLLLGEGRWLSCGMPKGVRR